MNSRYIRALGLRGDMGLPMVAGDVPVGVLSILFGTPRAFTDAERTSAGLLADCGAVAIGIVHARIARALAAGHSMAEVVERMPRIVRLERARDTGPHLPGMLDIDRSGEE